MLPETNTSDDAASADLKQRAIAMLRETLAVSPADAPIYVILRHRTRRGKATVGFVVAMPQRAILTITASVAMALDMAYDQSHEGIPIPDGDRLSSIVSRLNVALFGGERRVACEWI